MIRQRNETNFPCISAWRRADRRSPRAVLALPDAAAAFPYESLLDLREMMAALDAGDGRRLAVVLVLPPHFAGDLRALIQRRRQADRLTLTAAGGQFPALPDWSFLDAAREFGWRRISVEPDWRTAIQRARGSSADSVVLFWPAWAD